MKFGEGFQGAGRAGQPGGGNFASLLSLVLKLQPLGDSQEEGWIFSARTRGMAPFHG